MEKHALCLGNISYDLIVKKKSAKASFLIEAVPGGSVFNTSIILSKLNCPVTTIAKTGRDFLGNRLVSTLKDFRINTSCVFQSENIKTALALADINSKGDSSYIFYRPENDEASLKNERIPESIFKNAGILHTGSAFTYDPITFQDTLYFIKKARQHNIFISYDPNWREKRIIEPKTAKKSIFTVLEYVDLLKLSDKDALSITGAKTLSSALKKLPDNTIVTLGSKGVFHKKDREKTFVPSFKIKVADTIGAGDAFSAGVLCRYLKEGSESLNRNLSKTLLFAAAAASLVCSASGASAGLKNITQVNAFLKNQS